MTDPADEELVESKQHAELETKAPVAIDEDERPGRGLETPSRSSLQREKTRTWLAWTLVFTLLGLTAVGAIGWLCYGDDTERMQTFAVVFSPIVTLVGTVLGFYFSSNKD